MRVAWVVLVLGVSARRVQGQTKMNSHEHKRFHSFGPCGAFGPVVLPGAVHARSPLLPRVGGAD